MNLEEKLLNNSVVWKADPSTGAVKADGEKPRMDLVPVYPIQQLGQVLTYGANKYSERNWEAGMDWGRPYAAAQRHLMSWWSGEDLDPESGISHLSHALCNIAFLLEFVDKQKGTDSRPIQPRRNHE